MTLHLTSTLEETSCPEVECRLESTLCTPHHTINWLGFVAIARTTHAQAERNMWMEVRDRTSKDGGRKEEVHWCSGERVQLQLHLQPQPQLQLEVTTLQVQ